MRGVPSSLRAQVALWGMLACLLIPIGVSNLRGLTHILTCKEQAATPFTIIVPAQGAPTITSSSVITRNPDDGELCGGLHLDTQIGARTAEKATMTLTISNDTPYGWRGSVELDLSGISIPVDIGAIEPLKSASDTIDIRLDRNRVYNINGELLIGP
jgi:hypothetical protein